MHLDRPHTEDAIMSGGGKERAESSSSSSSSSSFGGAAAAPVERSVFTSYSVDDVYNWARLFVDDKYALKLKEEEMNGKNMLEVTKDELFTNLNIKFGPAGNLIAAINDIKGDTAAPDASAELRLQMADLRLESAEAQLQAVRNETRVRMLEQQLLEAKQTTARLLAGGQDEMAAMFDDAEQVGFWLADPDSGSHWASADVWKEYATRNACVSEKKFIQPLFSAGGPLFDGFPAASVWSLRDTSKSHELGLTHDVTLYQKNYEHSALAIGAIVELTGQDEAVKSYPSKEHKAKFVRDLLRVHMTRGDDKPVHGCVTDLSRIVCMKFISIEGHTPQLQRTALMTGAAVKQCMEAFAFSSLESLGVNAQSYELHDALDNSTTVNVVPTRQLGHGGNGRVFAVATGDDTIEDQFLKVATKVDDAAAEIRALRALQDLADLDREGVPALIAVCRTLQAVHRAGLVHRDVRPQNIVVVAAGGDAEHRAVLVDWASAVFVVDGPLYEYQGTYGFAAIGALDSLAQGSTRIPATPAFDLESLVYTVAWLSDKRIPGELTSATVNLAEHQRAERCRALSGVWTAAAGRSPGLHERVELARACNYAELITSWTNIV